MVALLGVASLMASPSVTGVVLPTCTGVGSVAGLQSRSLCGEAREGLCHCENGGGEAWPLVLDLGVQRHDPEAHGTPSVRSFSQL